MSEFEQLMHDVDSSVRTFAAANMSRRVNSGIPAHPEVTVEESTLEIGRTNLQMQNVDPRAQAFPGGGGGVVPPPGCVFVTGATTVNAGTSYVVGDNLSPIGGILCPPADDFGFQLVVNSVDGGGAVTGFTLTPGLGYTTPPSNPVVFVGSATGTGFTANCSFA